MGARISISVPLPIISPALAGGEKKECIRRARNQLGFFIDLSVLHIAGHAPLRIIAAQSQEYARSYRLLGREGASLPGKNHPRLANHLDTCKFAGTTMPLQMRELNESDETAFRAGLLDWAGESPHWYSFIWHEGMAYPEMLELLRKEKAGIDLAPGRVAHTMLYGFIDGEIIGRVSVRHCLNEYLRKRGGHIGYAVAKRFRRKGHATEMVRQALEYCRTLGIERVMVTCALDNTPSWKIIEHFGGKVEDEVWDEEDKEMIRRYWIELPDK